MTAQLTIGKAARATGLSVKTIRLYEYAGVVGPATRSAAGHRLYSEVDVRKLRLARRARLLGLVLAETRDLVSRAFASGCADYAAEVAALTERRIAEVDMAMAELPALRGELLSANNRAQQAAASADPGLQVVDCPCCLLMEHGEPACETAPAGPRWRDTVVEAIEVLACQIDSRPRDAPGPDELAPHVLSVTRYDGNVRVRFASEAAPIVEAFATAERVCCAGLSWTVEHGQETVLTIEGTPEQAAFLAAMWPRGSSEGSTPKSSALVVDGDHGH